MGHVAQTAQSFCKLKIPVPAGSSITDEGPIVLNILQTLLQSMLFSPKSLPSRLLFCWAKTALVWTLKWHHILSTHLVHLAGDITEGLVCFFSFHISIHHHCSPLQIQDTLIVLLLVLQRRYTGHHFSTIWSFLLHNSVLPPLQFSIFYQATYCANSVLLSFPSLCQLYAIFKGSLYCHCLHVWKVNQHKTKHLEGSTLMSVWGELSTGGGIKEKPARLWKLCLHVSVKH